MTIKQHIGHDREQNNFQQQIHIFCEILKRRASTESILLKNLYDEESRR